MEQLLKQWNGESVITQFDHPTGAWIVIAVHNTHLGPAGGGTRMKPYPNLNAAVQDALKLSESMTYKFAVSNLPRGGGKGVIAIPPTLNSATRSDLLRRYGHLIQQLGGLFGTGPDVGTNDKDMDTIAETGYPYIFGRSVTNGGVGGTGEATALGVFSGIEAVCESCFEDKALTGKQILVQGAGSVGGALITLLKQAGANVLFTDMDETVIKYFRDEIGLTYIPPDKIYDTPCDIFAPCALGGILNQETIPRLTCKAVAGSANNQLAHPTDATRLQDRGILYAPDFIINAGGAIILVGVEQVKWSVAEANNHIKGIKQTLQQVFKLAANKSITTEAAAYHFAKAKLS